ncbi:hypothetical protein BAUCODRAFT_266686 [Baudoinia panamericana UAMH 10762]|uniref:ABC transporter domain-containing protein n=1 Tax=Baudoinia panamericana (strain UAMH 10762) TaxID=717646 RepID=M2MN92_BAUPA|nr:uncharacterized protein BAUCODRAFT_266686 [Baudoinia panamericana UAMH 10762]EMC92913.1 hypothetical protein BAUCODRAFT_266686 [Baudoinia panamericana UAMH 10762]
MVHSRTAVALETFEYLSPLLVTVYFLVAKTIAACILQEPMKTAGDRSRRYFAACLLLTYLAAIVSEGFTLFVGQEGSVTTQATTVNLLTSFLVYGALTLGILENQMPLWHPYVGAFAVGFATEVLMATLQTLSTSDGTSGLRIVLHIIRTLALLVLAVVGSIYVLYKRRSRSRHLDETEPLLANGADGHVFKSSSSSGYGVDTNSSALHSGGDLEDDDDDISVAASDIEDAKLDKELRAQQRARLQKSGNWFNYLKDFKVFIPILWPGRDRVVQVCMAAVACVLLAERFLNVLVPRQLGILTERLAEKAGSGTIPWPALQVWLVLTWLQSGVGISLIKTLAELRIQQFAYRSIGTTAFRHIMGLSMNFHNEKSSGELIRAIEQGQNLQGMLEFVAFEVGPMLIDLTVAFVYVYTLFDVYMSLILLVVGLAYVWIGAKTTQWSLKQRRRFNNAWRNEAKVQNEAISNWQTVSHFNRGTYECERYGNSLTEFNASEWRYYLAYYVGGGGQSSIMLIGRLAATILAAYRVIQGRAKVGAFITLISYWHSVESPLMQVSYSIRRVSQMLTDSERLLQLLLTKPTVSSPADAPKLVVKEGEVEFDQVDFAYDPRKPILQKVSFRAKAGETIALVGETGGGKSTLLKLLYRYYDVNSGSIRIDGQDIRTVTLDSLRDSFGMVPQDPALFNVTLMENLKYARLDATDEEVMEACRAAAIYDKIESFPDKWKSTVGERGVKLSGGELQRVAIARAILRQPKIVLLDEATSMIDAETESLIQQALKRLTAGRTTFVIAHRLSTIQHADQILVIHDGQIVERGTHESLFQENGRYVALWSKQLSKEVKGVSDALSSKRADET